MHDQRVCARLRVCMVLPPSLPKRHRCRRRATPPAPPSLSRRVLPSPDRAHATSHANDCIVYSSQLRVQTTVCVKSYLLILVLLYQGDCVVCGSRHVTMYRIIYQVTTHRVDDARRTLGEREGRYSIRFCFVLDTPYCITDIVTCVSYSIREGWAWGRRRREPATAGTD
jgi:hypothetical protein